MSHLFTLGKAMLNKARREGGNTVIDEFRPKEEEVKTGRVAILEYDDFHAQLLKESLEALSMEVDVCTDGGEAINSIMKFHPDIIISEIYLLETDIFQIRQVLSRSLREKEIPIVIVSHQKDEASVGRALNLGILHYLKKPYMMSELLGLVDQIVRKRNVYGA
jgi:DNA-binding response OmpR family regulator